MSSCRLWFFALLLPLGLLVGCPSEPPDTICTPNDHTACMQGVTYWLDSCGEQGAVADICDCGCSADFTGCEDNCSCNPDCSTAVCGDDTCGGSCGVCGGTDVCINGDCVPCTPDCTGAECGDDGCGGSCGVCGIGSICDMGTCVTCTPNCAGKDCGNDGCGGSCGTCGLNETCDAAGTCQPNGGTPDLLAFNNCVVPFVLNADLVSDIGYMSLHFSALVQQYCVSGVVTGNDITAYPEKMYYGQHDSSQPMVSFVQTSMSAALAPEWAVKVDFTPDSSATAGSIWSVSIGGISPLEATVGLIDYLGTSQACLWAIGTTGTLTLDPATGLDQVEGGSYTLNGSALLTNPWDITAFCTQAPANLPCCVR